MAMGQNLQVNMPDFSVFLVRHDCLACEDLICYLNHAKASALHLLNDPLDPARHEK